MGWKLFLRGKDEDSLVEAAEEIVEKDIQHGNRPRRVMRSRRDEATEAEKRKARRKTKARRQRKNLFGF
jgi:hypothetical protein